MVGVWCIFCGGRLLYWVRCVCLAEAQLRAEVANTHTKTVPKDKPLGGIIPSQGALPGKPTTKYLVYTSNHMSWLEGFLSPLSSLSSSPRGLSNLWNFWGTSGGLPNLWDFWGTSGGLPNLWDFWGTSGGLPNLWDFPIHIKIT